ncbi:hypothetical protein PGT21_032839 [Puccinia graminis f. sp. tritici]|uniref:Uncharacterized protein n=1 Tax=Puccinia graminis f. sp. tritici TaxID=56615 RepID=A0A5B0QCI4_PUCGR|nr:hypothetical protein PGT21_032839 [Puccinia graminis f. sp. tritici]
MTYQIQYQVVIDGETLLTTTIDDPSMPVIDGCSSAPPLMTNQYQSSKLEISVPPPMTAIDQSLMKLCFESDLLGKETNENDHRWAELEDVILPISPPSS